MHGVVLGQALTKLGVLASNDLRPFLVEGLLLGLEDGRETGYFFSEVIVYFRPLV